MPGSGTRTFLEPDHYEASLRQAQIDIAVTPRGKFKARLTWAELHCLQVLRCEEEFARLAYLSLAPHLFFVTFAAPSARLPAWRGTELQPDDIVLHCGGDRLHQLTFGPCIWSVIALDPRQLCNYGRALSGERFSLPVGGQTLRPWPRHSACLRRLHRRICRLAETRPKVLSHAEVAHALEQDVIQAVVDCLTTAGGRAEAAAKCQNSEIMTRFEEILAEDVCEPLRIAKFYERIGVTEGRLRSVCVEFLGMSPTRYVLLRRLGRIRVALRDADPGAVSVVEIFDRFGLVQPGRFVAAYRAAFGESPSATLQRAPQTRFATR